jgi:hypothetical protein
MGTSADCLPTRCADSAHLHGGGERPLSALSSAAAHQAGGGAKPTTAHAAAPVKQEPPGAAQQQPAQPARAEADRRGGEREGDR